MGDLTAAFFALFLICGLYYFWYKCQIFAVSKFALLMGFLISPLGAVIGLYWAIKDFFLYRNVSTSLEEKIEIKTTVGSAINHSVISDEMYLVAIDEYENGIKDRALYARLYAEYDGKEELVKAKYIKHRVEKMIQSK